MDKKKRNYNYANKANSNVSPDADTGHQLDSNEGATEEEIDEIIKFLQNVVVDDKNIELVKSKLVASAARRMEMVKIPKLDFLEHFPPFFFRPELVCNQNSSITLFPIIAFNTKYCISNFEG